MNWVFSMWIHRLTTIENYQLHYSTMQPYRARLKTVYIAESLKTAQVKVSDKAKW